MAWKTGTSRTLTLSGDITGSLNVFNGNLDDDPSAEGFAQVSGGITFVGAGVTFEVYSEAYNDGVQSSIGYNLQASAEGVNDIKIGDFVAGSAYPLSGSYTISIPVEEWIETYGQSGGSGWHNDVPDAPPWTGIRFFEKTAIGNVVATITLAGQTASVSVPCTPGVEVTDAAGVNCAAQSVAGSSHAPGDSISSALVTVEAPGAPGAGAYVTNTALHASATGSAAAEEVMATTSSHTTTEAAASLTWRPDKEVDLAGVIRAMEAAYPESLTVAFQGMGTPPTQSASGGVFSRGFTQEKWAATAQVSQPGNPSFAAGDSDGKDTYSPVSAAIVGSSLSANGDEPLLTRLPIRGKQFPGLSLSQDATHTLEDDWTDPTITALGGATVGVSSGVLSIAAAGSPGGASVVFDPEKGASSYRFLRLRVRSVGSASQPFKVVIPPADVSVEANETDIYGGAETPTKQWAVQTGAADSWVNIDIDLCAPDNITASTDDQDSDYPRPTRRPLYMGVWRIPEIRFEGIPAGVTVEVDSVELRRVGTPYLDYLPTFYPSVYDHNEPILTPEWPERAGPDRQVSEVETMSYDYRRRFLLGRTDGLQSIDEHDLAYTRTVGGETGVVSYSFGMPSIEGLADAVEAVDGGITRWPGWQATINAPVNDSSDDAEDGYYNRDLPAVYLHGGGALYTQGVGEEEGTWSFGFDLAAGSVPAQPLYDEVDFYVGASLFYGGGTLRAAQILRAGGHGLVFDENHAPLSGETVEAKEGGSSRGDGTSDADGYYQTGANYLHADTTWRTAVLQAAGLTLSREFWPRRRGRGTFVAVEELIYEWLALDVSASGRLVRVGTVDDNLAIGFSADYAGQVWNDADTGIAGETPAVRYERQSASQRVWVVYKAGADLLTRYTDDEGGTWSVAHTVNSSGSFPALEVLPNGARHNYWRTSGGAIEGNIMVGTGGTVAVSTFTALASGVDDAPFAVRFDPSAQRFYLLYRSGGAPTVAVSDDGETFT